MGFDTSIGAAWMLFFCFQVLFAVEAGVAASISRKKRLLLPYGAVFLYVGYGHGLMGLGAVAGRCLCVTYESDFSRAWRLGCNVYFFCRPVAMGIGVLWSYVLSRSCRVSFSRYREMRAPVGV